MLRRVLFGLLLLSTLALSGCIRPYRISVEQGNVLNQSTLARIHVGTSRATVYRLLGRPVLHNVFADGRLVYVYTLKPGYGKMQRKAVIYHMRRGRVSRIEANVNPDELPLP